MKKVFLIFAFVLVTLQPHHTSGQGTNTSTSVLESWTDNKSYVKRRDCDLYVSGDTYASVYYVPGITRVI